MPLSIAVVGAGNRGGAHLDTISRLHDLYRLVAVCDAREERRQWAAAQYGVAVFDQPVTMLEQARPQVVAVVVPPDAHHLVTAAAARRGAHVIVETPIATTLAMADHMIETCRRHGVVLEVAENVWRWPAERLKRQIVERDLIGRVTQVHLWYRSGSYHGMSAARRFLTARPVRALGVSRNFQVPAYVDTLGVRRTDQTWELGVLEFEDGGVCVYQWPAGGDRGNHWEVIGTRGAIVGPELVLFDETTGRRSRYPIAPVMEETPQGGKTLVRVEVATEPPRVWENPYRRYALPSADDVARADYYASLLRAITRRTPPGGDGATGISQPGTRKSELLYGGANGRTDQELLVAIRESARQGSDWVELPLRGETALEAHLHQEFRHRYSGDPFEDPERLLGTFFPRRGLTQTVP